MRMVFTAALTRARSFLIDRQWRRDVVSACRGKCSTAPKTKGDPAPSALEPSHPPLVSTPEPLRDGSQFRISRRLRGPPTPVEPKMSTGPRKGVFLLLLLSHLASAQLNAVDPRPSRISAQIAHHTELPYIRDPPEPDNTVDGPLPDYDTSASPINGDDAPASTTELQTNNEANDINAADGLGVPGPLLLPGPSDSGSPAASLKLTSSARSTTSAPSGVPFRRIQYGPVHRSFKHTREPAHFETTFKCTFDNHACGMRNQRNIGQHFLRMNNSIAGRSGFYMAVDAGRVPAGVSRLITPYLPGYPNSHVCLNLTYALIGPGAERVQVVAQDVGNRPLFTLERYPQYSWRTFAINMTVHQDLRFFIEAYTNGKPGWVAIDDFKYTFNTCP